MRLWQMDVTGRVHLSGGQEVKCAYQGLRNPPADMRILLDFSVIYGNRRYDAAMTYVEGERRG